jgi:hypothetical protein
LTIATGQVKVRNAHQRKAQPERHGQQQGQQEDLQRHGRALQQRAEDFDDVVHAIRLVRDAQPASATGAYARTRTVVKRNRQGGARPVARRVRLPVGGQARLT